LGFGLIYLPAIVSVGFYFEKKRAIATGIAVSGSGIGTFIFSPANAALLEAYDWKYMLMIHAGIILNGCVCAMLMRPLEPPKRKKKKKIREKTMIDRVKEKAIANRKHVGESESSVQVVESFARLQEAKRRREERLKDDESDGTSMPSAYFVKSPRDSDRFKHSFSEAGESYCGSPVSDIPKITFTGIDNNDPQSPESPRSEGSDDKRESKETIQEKPDEEEEASKNDGNILNGVYSHEVEPLIENGYAKVVVPSHARDFSSAARLRIGSQHNIEKRDYARPLYRQDIFYSGSVNRIPAYTSQPDMRSYITSITTIPGEVELPPSSVWDSCTCLPKSIVDTLRDMLDFSLLKDAPFVLICVGNLFAMVGFYVPFAYLVDHALEQNVSKTDAAFLLSVIGE
jgi:hypothetical protein